VTLGVAGGALPRWCAPHATSISRCDDVIMVMQVPALHRRNARDRARGTLADPYPNIPLPVLGIEQPYGIRLRNSGLLLSSHRRRATSSGSAVGT